MTQVGPAADADLCDVIVLPVPGGLEVDALMGVLEAHNIPGCEVTDRDAARHRCLIPVAGALVAVTVALTPTTVRVTAPARLSPASRDDVVAVVHRWFDLDADLPAVASVLADVHPLGVLLRSWPATRVLGHPIPFQCAVTTVLGQQVSLAAGRTFAARLVARYGSRRDDGLVQFPTAATLADIPPASLQRDVAITSARARTVSALARACVDGLDLSPPDSLSAAAKLRSDLLMLPGIGPWTVEYLAMRAFGDRDAYPAGDLVLRRALGLSRSSDVAAFGERCRPYRSYAAMLAWTAAGYASARERTRLAIPGAS